MTLAGATLFTGGGGADIGMKMAGITPLWGIENNPDIADVARINGIPVTAADILDCDPAEFPEVDILHASPPCPNFSIAKTNAKETERDIELGKKVAQFIAELKPKVFTLENVWGYRNSKSWHVICDTLYAQGYWVAVDHVNFADLGVPQTRKRMIVRAIKNTFFGVPMPKKERWVGWYEAVKDLTPTFEATEFAPWQIARLPEEAKTSFLMAGAGNTNFKEARPGKGVIYKDSPSGTITTIQNGGALPRCFIIDSTNATRAFTKRDDSSPSFTITSSAMRRPSSSPMVYLNGRVLRLTPRALARLQSFPDSYQLPESKESACRIIGNACPPLGMIKIFSSLSTVATTDKKNLKNQIATKLPIGDCKEVTLNNQNS